MDLVAGGSLNAHYASTQQARRRFSFARVRRCEDPNRI